MNPMEYNPSSGIYEQSNFHGNGEGGNNIGGNRNRSNEGIGNTGGNIVFTPEEYQGYNSPKYKGVNFAAVRRAEIEAERIYKSEQKYKSSECAYLVQADKILPIVDRSKTLAKNQSLTDEVKIILQSSPKLTDKWDPFSEFGCYKRSEKEEFRLRLQKEEFAKEKKERAIQWRLHREKVAKEQEERNKKKRENEYKLFLQKKELAKEQEEQKEDRYLQYKNLHQPSQPLNKTLTKSISQIVLENLNSML
jgi:hypothetical protein